MKCKQTADKWRQKIKTKLNNCQQKFERQKFGEEMFIFGTLYEVYDSSLFR